MNKEFIPYNQALELKELEFNEECFGIYYNPTQELFIGKTVNPFTKEIRTFAPTYSQAFRWFREKYKLLSYVDYCMTETFRYNIIWDLDGSVMSLSGYTSYEEAELECLKQLIEITKNK